MANPEHLNILKSNVDNWNSFVNSIGEEFEVDLSRANLKGTNLTGANLTGAKLTEADLTEADLSEANLRRANLKMANLEKANLTKADLTNADLTWAKLPKANLTKAVLTRANLSWSRLTEAVLTDANLTDADLTKAVLKDADLSKTILRKTRFYSKSALNGLKTPLSDEQILSAIFEDEKEKTQQDEADMSKLSSLRIKVADPIKWDLMDFGLFFMCLQKTYNNVLYLMTTDETDLEVLKEQMFQGKWHPGADNNITLKSIQTGSWYIDILQSVSQYQPFITYMAVITAAYRTVSHTFDLYQKKLSITKGEIDIEKAKIESEIAKENLKKLRRENQREDLNYPLVPMKQKLSAEIEGILNNDIADIDFGQLKNYVIKDNRIELFSNASEPMAKIFLKLKYAGIQKIEFSLINPKNDPPQDTQD